MRLDKPAMSLAEIVEELDVINKNVFQIKMFTKTVCELIDKGESIQKMKHAKDIFNPMEAIKNLETK